MSRWESIAKGGFYPLMVGINNPKDFTNIDPRGDHSFINALANLIVPSAHSDARILDGTAGNGYVLNYLAKSWNMTPFGVELDSSRSANLISLLGFRNAINEDLMKARITPGSFQVVFDNPPFQNELKLGRGRRVEQRFLEFNTRFVQRRGGLHVFVSYSQHMTEDVAYHLFSAYENIRTFCIPFSHLNAYSYIVTIAQAGKNVSNNPDRDARRLAAQAEANYRINKYERKGEGAERPSDKDYDRRWPSILDVTEPLYEIPAPVRTHKRFYFAPNEMTKEMVLESVVSSGLHNSKGFTDLLALDRGVEDIRPLMLPRSRQYAGLLAAGMFNGLDLETEKARCLVRSVVRSKTVSVGTTEGENGEVEKETFRVVPQTTITLLFESGDVQDITGDEDIYQFITGNQHAMIDYAKESFRPIYAFDYVGGRYEWRDGKRVRVPGQLERFVRSIRLVKGETTYGLYAAQRHVVAAAYKQLATNRAVTISGEPGVGKTLMGAAIMEAFRFRTPDDAHYHELYAPLSKNRAARRLHKPMRPDQFNIVVAPPHLIKKWKREIEAMNPQAFVFAISSGENTKPIEELTRFIALVDEQPADVLKVLLMSREMFKAAEGKAPAYNIKHQRTIGVDEELQPCVVDVKIPICPTTGAELIDRVDSEDITRYIPVKRLENRRHFTGIKPGKKPERKASPPRYIDGMTFFNRYEDDPEAPETWRNLAQNEAKIAQMKFAKLNPEPQALWQEIRTFSSVESQTKGKSVRAALKSAMGTLVEPFPFPDLTSQYLQEFQYRPRKNPRASWGGIARILAKRYGDRIYMLVADEVHELKADDSAQGVAFTQLANAATRVVNMTGTLYGGAASSLYVIEYMTNPRVRRDYNWEDGGPDRWIDDMGVREYSEFYGGESDNKRAKDGKTTAAKVKRSSRNEAPGASPMLLREIVDHTIFISLRDLGNALPDMEEMGIPIQMDKEQAAIYREADSELTTYLNECREDGDSSFLGMYFQSRLNWANFPFLPYPAVHRRIEIDEETEEERLVVTTPYVIPGMGHEYITSKERWLLNVIREELKQGRGVGVYVRQTGDKSDEGRNTGKRISDLITREIESAKVAYLTSKVKSGDREEWIDSRKDCNVLVTNPNLVKTGLDLLQFPTLIWFELDYSLYTIMQASGRGLRIGQTKECRVIFAFFHMDFVVEKGEDGNFYEVLDDNGDFIPCADTVEAKGVQIVDRKRAAAAFLLGSEAGSLSALTDGGGKSLVSELAKAMSDASIVDSSAMFRKAAASEEEIWEADMDEETRTSAEEEIHCNEAPEDFPGMPDLIAAAMSMIRGDDQPLIQLTLW